MLVVNMGHSRVNAGSDMALLFCVCALGFALVPTLPSFFTDYTGYV